MIEATIYNPETGRILRTITVLDLNELVLNVSEGEAALPGRADVERQMVVDGAFVPRPPDPEAVWAALRAERDRRLAACDWTQLPDATVNREAWAAYRAALRDLPSLTTDPLSPIWPAPPQEI
ncbi:tail fiber assembly protein [Pseudotabrizicola alkalilacus]|uniref:Phage tail assembly chaperone-like domain-containing protein n=1 Tax=Pseudotabrizicola alkalilacus TaxID=2305252 RepID=A0A411Z7L0_9RHOB|nr:tail fiber assembly protein [Pseudotabrizicola alkalilacus]RGP39049.1 hypothetical protein D1012_02755 [Pseudotabrizicola alkalilacus]